LVDAGDSFCTGFIVEVRIAYAWKVLMLFDKLSFIDAFDDVFGWSGLVGDEQKGDYGQDGKVKLVMEHLSYQGL
jgi:hypothetical protein